MAAGCVISSVDTASGKVGDGETGAAPMTGGWLSSPALNALSETEHGQSHHARPMQWFNVLVSPAYVKNGPATPALNPPSSHCVQSLVDF